MADTLKSKYSTEASANTTENISDAVGSSEVDTILSVSICNSHTSTDTTFKMWIDGTTPNEDAYIYYNQALPAKGTFIHNSKIVLKEDDVLKFQTTAAVSCQIITSYLHQTAVATSSGSDYLDRFIHYQTGSSQSFVITPNNTNDIVTVLSTTVCNHSTTATDFDLRINHSGSETLIYRDQSLPGESTFEHADKIIVGAQDELCIDQSGSVNMSVVCSFLRQVP